MDDMQFDRRRELPMLNELTLSSVHCPGIPVLEVLASFLSPLTFKDIVWDNLWSSRRLSANGQLASEE